MINDQCSVIIVLTRSSDARSKNCQQLLALSQHRIDPLRGCKIHLVDKLEPCPCLSKLLQTQPELMDEIAPRFGGLDLTVVREGRGAAAGQIAELRACPRAWTADAHPIDMRSYRNRPVYSRDHISPCWTLPETDRNGPPISRPAVRKYAQLLSEWAGYRVDPASTPV